MAYSVRFGAIDDELTMTDPASDPERYARLQKRYLKLREDEFDAARLRWLDPSQWAVWHSAYLRPQWRPPRWCSIRSLTSVALWCETATA
jgi:hypothetical protein